ncbi:MAG: AIPR family protein [Betaproteobacteria bacterium]|nr:AIPR family protein [Betaproteobacteria bacterium]
MTIRQQPEMFFAFNNGIAATAENVVIEETSRGPKILSATNLQIVNGDRPLRHLRKQHGIHRNQRALICQR